MAENIAPTTAKFFPYDEARDFISRNTDLAVWV